jgi:hypothetical protein
MIHAWRRDVRTVTATDPGADRRYGSRPVGFASFGEHRVRRLVPSEVSRSWNSTGWSYRYAPGWAHHRGQRATGSSANPAPPAVRTPVGFHRLCSQAKKAAAFFKTHGPNVIRRFRGTDGRTLRVRRHPARCQYCQPRPLAVGYAPSAPPLVSPTPILAATCATGRPVSIARLAACSRNSGVYARRLPDIPISFPRDEQSQQSGVHHHGSTRSHGPM